MTRHFFFSFSSNFKFIAFSACLGDWGLILHVGRSSCFTSRSVSNMQTIILDRREKGAAQGWEGNAFEYYGIPT